MPFHLSAFGDETAKHGGVRRTEQLAELATARGLKTLSPPALRYCFQGTRGGPLLLIQAVFLSLRLGVAVLNFKGFRRALRYAAWLIDFLEKLPDNPAENPIWVEIGPNRSLLIAALLAKMGRDYVAYPHNIEFLVPHQSQKIFRNVQAEFKVERMVYLRACRVVTISDFDAAVVRSLGVNSVQTLRYEPVGAYRQELLEIRKKRGQNKHCGFLILGSATNTPTRDGMQKLLDEIANLKGTFQFTLAGYGTEVFRNDSLPASVSVLGAISREKLADLFCSCEALLVSQPQTSGMLTRLIDAEVSGVPVYLLGDYLQAGDPMLRMTKRLASLEELSNPLFHSPEQCEGPGIARGFHEPSESNS